LEENNLEREEIYRPDNEANGPFELFKLDFNNIDFRISGMTFVSFFILLLFVAQGLLGDQSESLPTFTESIRLLMYIFTIVFQWVIFLLIYFTVVREKTFLSGIGLVKIRSLDIAWGIALLVMLFLVATGFSYLLTQIGIPPKGELSFLLPEETIGKFLWVIMSFTAGFCEEVIFRGYLMTRLRLLGKFKSWIIPIIVSSLAFGFPHLYQGIHGFLIITILGVLFALIYIRTRSIWPCIIAHFFLDFLALFIPID
jgi:membrane protease YdiL (CAAX protease family)